MQKSGFEGRRGGALARSLSAGGSKSRRPLRVSNMRLRTLVAAFGAVILPLGMLQGVGLHSWLISMSDIASAASKPVSWLPSSAAAMSAYAAYGYDTVFAAASPTRPPPTAPSLQPPRMSSSSPQSSSPQSSSPHSSPPHSPRHIRLNAPASPHASPDIVSSIIPVSARRRGIGCPWHRVAPRDARQDPRRPSRQAACHTPRARRRTVAPQFCARASRALIVRSAAQPTHTQLTPPVRAPQR